MISGYKIINIGEEERLVIFLNLNYEFGGINSERKNLKQILRNYIKNNKINFRGGIITFVVGGVMIGNVIFNNNEFRDYKPTSENYEYVSGEVVKNLEASIDREIEKEVFLIDSNSNSNDKEIVVQKENYKREVNNNTGKSNQVSSKQIVSNNQDDNKKSNDIEIKKENVTSLEEDNDIIDNNIYVNLKKKDGNIVKIELEEYLVGVVGAEMPALFDSEALKAQAIIARTYAIKAMSKGKALKDNESNQSYKTNNELKSIWGDKYNTYYNKIVKAVSDTKGMVLTYNGAYIEAVYHSTSNGVTESSVNVWGNYYPYLVSVSSEYDNLNVSFEISKEMSYHEISDKLGFGVDKETVFELNGRTSGNRVGNVIVGEHTYTGIDFRNILGLRSADFDIQLGDNGIIFTTRGYGHGVGLSQYGANGMAKNGYNYEKILKHYYPGVSLTKI